MAWPLSTGRPGAGEAPWGAGGQFVLGGLAAIGCQDVVAAAYPKPVVGFVAVTVVAALLVFSAAGDPPGGERAAIAAAAVRATARVYGITVVTRNAKDFELAGIQVLDPFTN